SYCNPVCLTSRSTVMGKLGGCGPHFCCGLCSLARTLAVELADPILHHSHFLQRNAIRSVCPEHIRPKERALIDVAFVEGRALAGNKAGVFNDPSKLSVVCTIFRAGGADDVLLDHDASHVVHAESQPHLSDFQADRKPGHLNIGKVIEVNAAQSEQ